MTPGLLLTTLAYFVGGLVLYLAARQRKLATEGIGWVVLAGLAGGVAGARLTEWVVSQWPTLAAQPLALLDPRLGGRTLIGGIVVGWVCVEIAKKRLGIRRSTGDLFALALPAGEAVGRLGCFFNGCCYGVASGVPWSVYQHEAWRHPAQLYAAGWAALTLGVLLAVRRRVPREGDLFRAYLVLFGLGRVGVELFRERTPVLAGLSTAQWICLELALAGAAALALSAWRARPLPRPATETGGPEHVC
ncbi:MAG: prolipoprotein diacylglyceryl transferase [Armatimonadota bacterium]